MSAPETYAARRNLNLKILELPDESIEGSSYCLLPATARTIFPP
jgi:hypothetical protein